MVRTLLTSLLVVCAFTGFGARFSGVVKDLDSKVPIPYATIDLSDIGTTIVCDSLGSFDLDIILPNNFGIVISAFGYQSKKMTLSSTSTATLELFIRKSHTTFGTIIVSSPRNALEYLTISNIESVDLRTASAINGSLSDVISTLPGVYQNTTGTGISKPVIRGLSGNRVVTYLNGLRIENQQWAGDHALGISDVGIGRVEVIKGPASLLYGSDALGV